MTKWLKLSRMSDQNAVSFACANASNASSFATTSPSVTSPTRLVMAPTAVEPTVGLVAALTAAMKAAKTAAKIAALV